MAYKSIDQNLILNCLVLLLLWVSPPVLASSCGEGYKSPNKAAVVDMFNDWGSILLKPNDKAYREKEYLDLFMQTARPYAHGDSVFSGKYSQAMNKKVNDRFIKYWNLTVNGLEVKRPYSMHLVEFTLTGTAANNLIFKYVIEGSKSKRADKALGLTPENVKLISFEDVFSGNEGPIVGPRVSYIKAPYINSKTSESYLSVVERQEGRALEKIKSMIEADPFIKGIVLESITNGWNGVEYFRPTFLTNLMKLAKEKKVLIIADEIYTGGGRTGEFWAFQHFEGFRPDYISFGKGLGIAGIARLEIGAYPRVIHEALRRPTTISANPSSLVLSSQILKTIHERDLVKNSREMGQYLSKRLGEAYDGVGLHFRYNEERMIPPISMTKRDVGPWLRSMDKK
ncbi:MAG: aminotransferase class III-fold pyridoxal phosphate-dependent enzyme [Bdellovibrionales bacterium]